MMKTAHRRQIVLVWVSRAMVLGLVLLTVMVLLTPKDILAQAPSSGWTTPEDIAAPISAGNDLYGTIICDPNQNLHILWSKNHSDGSEIYYRTDAGGTLAAPIDVLALPDPLAIHLSATLNQRDWTLHLIWQNSYIRGDVFYSKVPLAEASDPHAWDTPRLVIPQADYAQVLADNSGSLHLIYGASETGGYRDSLYHMRSDDGGLSWSEPSPIYETGSVATTMSGAGAFDAAGRLHIGITTRSLEYGVYSELGYMRSLDGGQTWQPYQVIATQSEATPNVAVIVPWAFGADEIHLTWHDPRRMHMWSNDGGTTWTTPSQIIELGAGFGGSNYLAKDSAGVLRAVTGVANGIYVSTLTNSQWGAPEQIENRRMDPHGQELVVCQGNQLHVVYDDRVVKDTTVWYSHKQVDTPHLKQSPIPTQAARTSAVPASREVQQISPIAEPISNRKLTLSQTNVTPPTTSGDVLGVILISTTSVVVLTSAVLSLRRLKGR